MTATIHISDLWLQYSRNIKDSVGDDTRRLMELSFYYAAYQVFALVESAVKDNNKEQISTLHEECTGLALEFKS